MMRRGGLLRGAARTAVVAGTATAVAGGVHHRQERRWAEKDQQADWEQQQQEAAQQAQAQQYAQQAEQAPAAGGDDLASKIKQLADLKAAGALSDDEFTAAKAKLLS